MSPLLPSENPWRPQTSHRAGPSTNDAYDLGSGSPLVSPIMSRTPSVAGSDRYSTISGVTGYWPQNPENVQPAAAYVAPFGAVQVVNEHSAASRRSDYSSDEEDEQNGPAKDDAQFSPQALALINSFLDQLLYSFLSTARSTSLHALRPAVNEVLKQRLAKEAVANADEELQELLAGGEEEDERNAALNFKDNRKWDLELVWKRTRLRVMVYMRLGEMEDEDEERHVKEQELFYGREADSRRFSSSSGLVSWSAAIFLTSVLEFVAEQSLQAAGSAAYARARRQSKAQQRPAPAEPASPRQFTVEDFDVEKIALDVRLGRLWRTWRKTLRNDRRPMTPSRYGMMSRSSFTRDRAASLSALRRGSMGHYRDDSTVAEEQYRELASRPRHFSRDDDPEGQYPEHVLAANIPLPMRDAKRDVDEIEVPGLARSADEAVESERPIKEARRNSFTSDLPYRTADGSVMQTASKSKTPGFPFSRPTMTRQRSKSVPNPPRTPKLEIPGAFPLMPEEQNVQAQEEVQGIVPEEVEPKASAVDMQPHKQNREESKVLLDDSATFPRKAEDPVTAPAEEKEELPKEEQSTGLLSGIAAGAAAVAGAAVGATAYNHYSDKQEDKSLAEDFPAPAKETREIQDAPLPQPRQRSSREIRELDQRKSLVDLKSVMAADSTPRSRETSPARQLRAEEPVVSQPDAALDRSASANTDESYTLGHRERPAPIETPAPAAALAQPAEIPYTPKENGHKRQDTTTMAALLAPASPSEILDAKAEEQKARDMPMIGSPRESEKPSRLIITGDEPVRQAREATVATPVEKVTTVEKATKASPKTPREYLTNRDLPVGSDQPSPVTKPQTRQSPNEQTRANAPRPGSAGTLSVASDLHDKLRESKQSQSPRTQKSVDSTKSRSVYSAHQKSDSEVQNHPAMPGMGTPKREVAVPATGSGTSTPPVTSASIRGPEDFDNFLQSEDTVKYTLTPETVRDNNTSRPVTAVSAKKVVSDANALAKLSSKGSDGTQKRDSSPTVNTHARSRSSRGQSIKNIPSVSSQPQPDRESTRERRRSISKPPPRNTSAHRRSGLVAREPQVMTASTRDFADFIRSTGPDREQDVQRLHTSRSVTSLQSAREKTSRSQSVGGGSLNGERTKSLTQTTMEAENIPPVPKMPASESKKPKPQLQARSATGAASGTRDLINFIRDGPEEQGSHRISRTVAPFRNTMDSDRFDELGGGDFSGAAAAKANGAKNTTTTSQPAAHSTPSTAHASQISQPHAAPAASKPAPSSDGRKRYRNKDPYAIPSDSEDEDFADEDDDLTALPRSKPHPQPPREESLADFLRNSEPPSTNAPQPISATNVRPRTTQAQTNGGPVAAPNPTPAPTPAGPKLSARPAGAPRQRIPRGNAGARLGAYEASNTGDLADFLRSSGPDEGSQGAMGNGGAPAPVVGRQQVRADDELVGMGKGKKKGGFFGAFRRREKV